MREVVPAMRVIAPACDRIAALLAPRAGGKAQGAWKPFVKMLLEFVRRPAGSPSAEC